MPDIDPMLEDPKPGLLDDTDTIIQQYPSPTVEGQDTASFFSHNHAEEEEQQQQQQLDQQQLDQQQLDQQQLDQQQLDQQQLDQQQLDQQQLEHDRRQSEQQDEQEQQQPPTPRQHPVRPSITSAEELQLAAQLSQDLSQGMPTMLNPTEDPNLQNAIAQHEPQDPQLQQSPQPDDELQHEHEHESIPKPDESMSHHDQPIPSHTQSMNNHEQPLQQHGEEHVQHQFISDPQQQHQHEHQHEHQHQQQLHHHQQHELQQLTPQQPILSHHPQAQPQVQPQPQPQPQPHPQLQLQPPPQQQPPHHLQHTASVEHLAQQYAAQAQAQAFAPDNTPPRKRSKVSRACDECRRKKVKCDAVSENGEEPCSNCRRSAIRCLFSRIPQKRGPSKGYIKELADRINSIEGKLASEGGNVDSLAELLNGTRRDSADIFTPSGQTDENSRKRPYSSISGADFGTPTTSRQATWSSEPRPIQPYQTPAGGSLRGAPYSANGLAPQPLSKPDAGTASQPAAVMEPIPLDLNHNGALREIDEDAFNVYLNVVHPYLPLLAGTKVRVEAQLAQCPPRLRDAFIEALYCTMQSSVSSPGRYTNGDVNSATRMITEWESDSSPRTLIINVVHLQTLILAAIATDNYGPSSLKGEHGGPSKASVLGRAVGLAYSMRLHVSNLDSNVNVQLDHDSDDNVATRAWWTLIMLDRWNAIGTATPLFIPNDSVVILPSLNSILGENVYHLARLSNILGHFAPVSLAPPQALSPESGAVPILNSFFNLSIELFREVLPPNITPSTHPILHLVYWHCRLLAYLFQTNSKSTDILWPCKESVNLLLTNTQLLSPLNHHFFCLTTLTLLELVKVDRTRDEANLLLKELLESNLAPSTWDAVIRDRIAESLRPSTAQAAASQSLRHLADLATASETEAIKPEMNGEAATLRTSQNYADVGFDPKALTRGGYLNVLAEARFMAAR